MSQNLSSLKTMQGRSWEIMGIYFRKMFKKDFFKKYHIFLTNYIYIILQISIRGISKWKTEILPEINFRQATGIILQEFLDYILESGYSAISVSDPFLFLGETYFENIYQKMSKMNL